MSKVYYKATGPTTFTWVATKEEATQEPHKQAAEVTLNKFKGAELEEIPAKTQQTTSSWVIGIDK